MSATRSGPGHEHDHSITCATSERLITTMHGRAGSRHTPGSVLIAELAPKARLQAGTARTYLYAELNDSKS